MMVKRKEQTAGAKSRSVLIVDDEEDILELIELTLLRMGLDVDRATTVKTAIEKARSGNYDLCLTDMRLPDGEGLELVQFISDNISDLPVAVLPLTAIPRTQSRRSRPAPSITWPSRCRSNSCARW